MQFFPSRCVLKETESQVTPSQCRRWGPGGHIRPRQDVAVPSAGRRGALREAQGYFCIFPPMDRYWYDLVCWVFKCAGKGTLFAPNKSCLGSAFPAGASVRGARQQLRHSELLPSTSGKARYGPPRIVLLFQALLWVAEAIFFSVFAANMFKFALFWRQVVNASEVHT